ncbi:MAG: ATP synthase F1 subunit delta [Microscillaceae bacterium]|nr:ATP synthase F1 subunit delta [Microscillaceae bacterium]
MSDTNVAKRYAKPILELAQEQGIVDIVYQDMLLFKKTCDANKELLAVLNNPIIRGYKKFLILKALFQDKVNPLTLSLFEIMGRKNRESVLYSVSQEFAQLYNRYMGIEEVKLTSATPLPDALKQQIKDKLAKELNKTIILEESVSPSLIGGFVIQIGNSQIDSSIKSSLQRLKMNFIQNLYK